MVGDRISPTMWLVCKMSDRWHNSIATSLPCTTKAVCCIIIFKHLDLLYHLHLSRKVLGQDRKYRPSAVSKLSGPEWTFRRHPQPSAADVGYTKQREQVIHKLFLKYYHTLCPGIVCNIDKQTEQVKNRLPFRKTSAIFALLFRRRSTVRFKSFVILPRGQRH